MGRMSASAEPIDSAFQALASPTRRAVIERLGRGPATVSELAEPFEMALPSFMQHLRVLEESGLVSSRKRGRVRTLHIMPDKLRPVVDWITRQSAIWEKRLDRLEAYVNTLEQEKNDTRPGNQP